ncbi:uncharacterized protein [Montipora capricornis]|uniref:uncharacterized protein n=1 Tax=Montipora capricornis TaxID=246305 RepID=UPI0035F15B02
MKRGDAFFATVGNKFCCSEHFLPTDFKRSLTGHRRDLKPGSVPSVFPWTKVDEGSLCRAKRLKLRCEKSDGITRAESAHENIEQKGIAEAFRNDFVVFGPTTLNKWIDEIKMEHGRLLQELQEFKAKERISKFGLERFSSSDEDINFFTGFPDYVTLLEFWKYVEPNASKLTFFSFVRDNTDSINFEDKFLFMAGKEKSFPGRNVGCARSLQPIDEFWLFLTRLRLGLFERDLAFRFSVSEQVVSDIIITWANYLYLMLGSLPIWSSKEQIKQHLPEVFKGEFENIRCIIDCTEIKCQTPQDLEKQSELYSEYKSHNTFKGLVGISPNVWITFVSSLYGGSISDKEIVKNSSFVDLLDQHDLIMADRGFDIQDLMAKKKVTLFIPPKRQSKSEQFSKEDCFETMRIANLRIHVERAIRRIKGWHIFDSVVPLSLFGVINQLWTVTCLLVNWQKPALTC